MRHQSMAQRGACRRSMIEQYEKDKIIWAMIVSRQEDGREKALELLRDANTRYLAYPLALA